MVSLQGRIVQVLLSHMRSVSGEMTAVKLWESQWIKWEWERLLSQSFIVPSSFVANELASWQAISFCQVVRIFFVSLSLSLSLSLSICICLSFCLFVSPFVCKYFCPYFYLCSCLSLSLCLSLSTSFSVCLNVSLSFSRSLFSSNLFSNILNKDLKVYNGIWITDMMCNQLITLPVVQTPWVFKLLNFFMIKITPAFLGADYLAHSKQSVFESLLF